MQLLATLLISALTLVDSVVIHSDHVTDRGDWGHWDQCPAGSFVKAIDVKVQDEQYDGDDTALNAVYLSCVELDHQVDSASFPVSKVLKSAEGPWGYLRGIEFCHGGVAIGFQLRSGGPRPNADETAANDMVLICSDSQGNYKTRAEGQSWGTWGTEKICPPRMAVCGLLTQVEAPQGTDDDTALNNVDLQCCDLPNPATTCQPTDDWQEILRHDNIGGTTPLQYTLTETVGVQKTLVTSESSSVVEEIAESVGFGINYVVLRALAINFETHLATSKKTQHQWFRTETAVFTVEREETAELNIPARCEIILYQLIGNCGPYVINSNVIKRVDRCYDGRRFTRSKISYDIL